ncbi:MAG: protein kinase [Pirellulales bacterium]|nr:protein kinase [Pirellulales bacterium]
MGNPSAEELAQRAFDMGLLTERQLQDIWASFGSRNIKLEQFLQLLVRRELLTNYQVERLLKGERSGFFFGDYKILYLVGSGTFARVYRAVHKDTGQVVAVKVLRKRYSENTTQYGQFVREGRLGCSLRHPNIVPIYEVYSRAKTHFLVMEFVEGRNLREFVKIRKRIEPPEATRLMIDIVQGMRYAFENGLTHRDLKMNNVLVSSRGQAKLVDFGLAAVDETLSDELLIDLPNTRTIDYAALERATGVRKDDTRSDIYFLGCIYYHMMIGRPPLREVRDRVQRLSRNRFLEVKSIRKADPTIADSVALVVNKAMMLDPARRYQSPGNMLADLEIALKRVGETSRASHALPASGNSRAQAGHHDRGTATAGGLPENQPSVMIVESNTEMQQVFREGLKRAGYRVLMTIDPGRAHERFRQEVPAVADCVMINAQQIGHSAVEAFNRFGEDLKTSFVPAVLLLDESQRKWKHEARTDHHRVVLPMPITMKQLRVTLAKLVNSKAKR